MKVRGQLVERSVLPSTTWVLGIKLRSSGFAASAFSHGTTMLILKSRFLMYLLKVGGLRISLSGREGFDLAYARL